MATRPNDWMGTACRVWTAAAFFYLSAVLLLTWRDPLAIDDGRWVRYGVGLILLEFLFVHSAPFIANVGQRRQWRATLKAALGMVLFYALFAVGMILSVKEPRLWLVYLAVMGGRVLGALGASQAEHGDEVQAAWAIGVVAYLLCVFASVFLPVPAWGLGDGVGHDLLDPSGDGAWEEEPHRAIAAATLYFAILGCAETVFVLRAVRRWWQAPAA